MTPDTDAMHAWVLANLDSMALEFMVPVGHAQKWEQRALAAEAEVERMKDNYARYCIAVIRAGIKSFGTLDEGIAKLAAKEKS